MLELRDRRSCYPEAVAGVNVGLAFVDGVIAFLAFYKLIRIHARNSQIGWTRQKVFHLIIGSSNLGYLLHFVLALVAACKGWVCWSHSCGFFVMAIPRILFIAAFLLLLSFWVDLCHQSNDDDDDEEDNSQELLLEKGKQANSKAICRRCCSFRSSLHIGSRQKVVILVIVIIFSMMITSAVLIHIAMRKNPVETTVIAQVYVDLIAVIVLLLGGALAFYGFILFFKMKQVRSEWASSEMWKVASLAVVCVISFSSSALIAITTNIPLFYRWNGWEIDVLYTSLLLVLYYFIGSSVPSAFILFVMRELPPPAVIQRQESEGTIAFISEGTMVTPYPRCWTAATSAQVSRASPI
ncbi:tobamovirus multiplication protein 1-like isoform X2 [Andrographis paniculata]|uniref:tobamovirus multiplication protein 1-like isoform X2 n=1 Tax=Andrographis paniculata TaxID=175694 RepID=UPI0021E8E288|nr:tobamovirus multiplication protein 1-like isoform X2 [Andrographis paniculata]